MFQIILIIAAFNLNAPNEPAILIHNSYATMQECQTIARHMAQDKPANLRMAAFCVKAKDLITNES